MSEWTPIDAREINSVIKREAGKDINEARREGEMHEIREAKVEGQGKTRRSMPWVRGRLARIA